MSKIEVNAIEPQSGTTLTLGASGDTITIPSGATINNQGSAVNFGPTGAVSWNTTKVTTGFTAVSGVGYFCDTTSAAFTVTLPSSPSAGAVVGIADYANTFATNNLTLARNGSNIAGTASYKHAPQFQSAFPSEISSWVLFYDFNNDGKPEFSINSRNMPDLKVSKEYLEMLKEYSRQKNKDGKEATTFIKSKIESAQWFIEALNQRHLTLMICMQAILEFQEEYFMTGDESKLKPMILKDIATKVEMDISTVSRMANSKYAQTPYGTFLLKTFFSESMSTESGEEVSSREIKKILKDSSKRKNQKCFHSKRKQFENFLKPIFFFFVIAPFKLTWLYLSKYRFYTE
jgi:hypothetical protein